MMISTKNENHEKKFYDQFHSVTKRHKRIINHENYTHDPFIKLIGKYTSKKNDILDIGCGAGSLDFYLASNGRRVTGIDISQKAIKSCNSNVKSFSLEKNTKFVQASLENYKTRKKFDLILCIEVIEHLKDDRGALNKIKNMLKSGGVLILSTPSKNAPLHRLGYLKKFDKRVGHLRRYTISGLKKKTSEAGLLVTQEIKTEGIVRNFIFTSFIGGKIILRLINRFSFIREFFKAADEISLSLFGESDLIIVAKK